MADTNKLILNGVAPDKVFIGPNDIDRIYLNGTVVYEVGEDLVCVLHLDGTNFIRKTDLPGLVGGIDCNFYYINEMVGVPTTDRHLLLVMQDSSNYAQVFHHQANRFYFNVYIGGTLAYSNYSPSSYIPQIGDEVRVRFIREAAGSYIAMYVYANEVQVANRSYNNVNNNFPINEARFMWVNGGGSIPTSAVMSNYASWVFNSGNISKQISNEYPNDSAYDMELVNVVEEDWDCT